MTDELNHESLKDLVLRRARVGDVIFRTHDDFRIAALDEFIEQPTEGLLYDLNRDRASVLSFIDDPKWVNDFAVSLVIERLKDKLSEIDQLKDEIIRQQAALRFVRNSSPSETEIVGLRADNACLRAALEQVEYRSHECPWCGGQESDGHFDNCQRQAALKGCEK